MAARAELIEHYKQVKERMKVRVVPVLVKPAPVLAQWDYSGTATATFSERDPLLGCPSSRIKAILEDVCRKRAVTEFDVKGSCRTHECVRARHEFIWRLRRETELSLPMIGRVCGGKDHTTVLHAIRAHQYRVDRGLA